ncbi:2,3-bisphosphoglycerate-independent phosphoglycerate mutase [Polyangium mundeleinium]|uniref:phosphoglycerate mutase (2,3-diphosphoglycerate-independent) n=1 Tax=Polyangium mundeleinium TaxID=2995306 RepID=A0ABT5EKQ9_9BACT|nr:2,3-bisphosphoglycerate-independent phosphoglycerate mutase [Polyangium mundeleinium]MDC0742384.1 2,3-bisphosphoglycerate-independent phosphoglycerate mutase [Polyangium mundeleinium]
MVVARQKPVVLCLLDGLGERDAREGNAVRLAKAEALARLGEQFGKTRLQASGEAVGLGAGKVGTGALGYEAIGTGRTPRPARTRIDEAIAAKKLWSNKVIERAMWIANDRNCRMHLFTPISADGAHGTLEHLRLMVRVCEAHDVKVVVHAFLEERASAPRSAWKLLEPLAFELEDKGVIGTIAGQSYAMDRSGRWDRVEKAYAAIVRGEAKTKETPYEALQAAYQAKLTDGNVEPTRIGEYEGMVGSFMADFASGQSAGWAWFGEEAGLVLTHRADRVEQLAAMLVRRGIPPEVEAYLTDRKKPVYAFDEFGLLSLVGLDPALEVMSAFPDEPPEGTLGDVIAAAGLTQLRIAEPDRARHVAQGFDGGRRTRKDGEEIRVVEAENIAEAATRAIREGSHDVVIVSLAAMDHAAHRGDLAAAIAAVEAVDAAVAQIAAATEEKGGALFVVGTHGGCEEMLDAEGKPRGGHTTNVVPFVSTHPRGKLADDRSLADVAKVVLEVLGIEAPSGMTGGRSPV